MDHGRYINAVFLATLLLVPGVLPAETPQARIATVAEAVEMANKRSLAIKQRAAVNNASVLRLKRDRDLRNPELRSSYEEDGGFRRFSVGLRLRVPNPMTRAALGDATKHRQTRLTADLEQFRWLVRCDVKLAFLQAAIVDLENALVEQHRKLWKSSRGKKVSKASAKLALAELKIESSRLVLERNRARRQLAQLIGMPSDAIKLAYKYSYKKPKRLNRQKLLGMLDEHSLNTRLKPNIAEREARLLKEKRERIPWFNFFDVNYERQPDEDFIWNAQIGVELPIFSWNTPEVERQQSLLQEARLTYKMARLALEQELLNAIDQYEHARLAFKREHALTGKAMARALVRPKKRTLSAVTLDRFGRKVAVRRIYLKSFLALKEAEIALERIVEKSLRQL